MSESSETQSNIVDLINVVSDRLAAEIKVAMLEIAIASMKETGEVAKQEIRKVVQGGVQ